MTDLDAILAAVLAHPDEDTPRLMYADELDAQGQHERAEFIRVQVKLHSGGPHTIKCSKPASRRHQYCRSSACDWCALHRRAWALWKRNYRQWEGVPRLTNYMNRDSLRRGFVGEITCAAAYWLQHADSILSQHPVREVRLTDIPLLQGAECDVGLHNDSAQRRFAWQDIRQHADQHEREIEVTGTIPQCVLELRWPHITFALPIPF